MCHTFTSGFYSHFSNPTFVVMIGTRQSRRPVTESFTKSSLADLSNPAFLEIFISRGREGGGKP